jgi:hypothetical protein
MRTLLLSGVLLEALWVSRPVGAEEPLEHSRVNCRRDDPGSRCPGPDCTCIPDTLRVTFDGNLRSVLEYDRFSPGMPVPTTVVLDGETDQVQGWSFGVDHDDAFLALTGVTVDGTDAGVALNDGFVMVNMEDVQICLSGGKPDVACRQPQPATGYVEAVVLSLKGLAYLDPGPRSLVKAEYVLNGDPGFAGTEIKIVDYLGVMNSPPAAINITASGKSRAPESLTDGWVKLAGCAGTDRFLRGDIGLERPGGGRPADGIVNISDAIQILSWLFLDAGANLECKKAADTNDDGKIELTDAIYLLLYLFSGGPALPAPFPEAGPDPTGDGLGCCSYGGGVLRAEKAARADLGEAREEGSGSGDDSYLKLER